MRRFKKVFVTLLVVATILGTASAFTSAAGLLDVEGTKYADSVNKLVSANVLTGFPDGTFKPAATVTRAQMAAILVRALGLDGAATLAKGATPFADVPATHWASGYVNVAFNKGIITGVSETSFKPDDNVTYAQAATMLVRATGHAGEVTGAWPQGYIEVATKLGLVANTNFASSSPTTRGDVAIMTSTAVYDVKDAKGETLAWSALHIPAAQPDKDAPVITLGTVAASTTADKVTVTGTVTDASAVTVKVNGTAVAVTNGAFSADVALTVGANTIKVDATDAYNNASSASASVARLGAAKTLTVTPATATVAAGGTQAFTVSAVDEAGQAVAVTPTFTVDNGSVAADGTYTAPTTPGSATVTIIAGDLTASATVTVTVGAVDHIAVTPATATMASATTQQFSAKALDAQGNEVPGVTFSWTATGSGIIDASGMFAATGSGTATVKAAASGKEASASVTVYGAPTKLVLSTPASLVANGASTTTVTATAVDANGNTAANWSGTVTFTSLNTGIVTVKSTTASVAAVNGVATATLVAGTTVGTAQISASATGLTAATANATTTAQTLTSVSFKADPATLAADNASTSTLTATLLDQTGNFMRAVPASGVAITLTSGTTTVATVGALGGWSAFSSTTGITATATVTAGTAVGSSTITPTITTSGLSAVTVNPVTVSTLVVGAPYKLAIDPVSDLTAGNSRTIKVRIYDYNGNQVTNSASVAVTMTEGTTTTVAFGGTVNTTNGVATFTYGPAVAGGTKAGAKTFTASATFGTPTVTLVKATATANVLANTASTLSLSSDVSDLASNGTSTATLTAKVKDAYGNTVTDGSYAVKFVKTAGSPTATAAYSDTTVNTANGVATTIVTASTNDGGSDTYTVSATGLVSATTTITSHIMGVPAKLGTPTKDADQTVGNTMTVTVDVQDSATPAHRVTSDSGRTVTLSVYDSSSTLVDTLTATTVSGRATFSVSKTVSGPYTFKATSEGLTKSASGTGTFNAGSAAALKVSPTPASIAADGTSRAALKVYAVDTYGNKTTGSNPTAVSFTVSNTAIGGLYLTTTNTAVTGPVNHNLSTTAGDTQVDLKSASGIGTVTVTASATNLTSGSIDITTQVVGSATQLGFATITTKTAGTRQAVTVQLKDAAGNLVTGNSVSRILLAITGQASDASLTVSANSDGTGAIPDANAAAGAYGSAATVAAGQVLVNGSYTYYVNCTEATALTYSVTTDAAGVTGTYTATGTFTAGLPDDLVFNAPSVAAIRGNGSDITTISVKVVDDTNNTVTSVSGNAVFSVYAGNDYAQIIGSSTAPFVNGVATVSIQSKVATNSKQLTIRAYTTDVTRDNDGVTPLANGGASGSPISSTAIKVDGMAPTITTMTVGGSTLTTNVPVSSGQPAIVVTPTDNAAIDADNSGLAKAVFQYRNPSVTTAWTDLYTDTTLAVGNYEMDWTGITALLAGTYDFRAVVYDNAGNAVTTSTYNRTVDLTPPTVTQWAMDMNSNGAAKSITLTFSEPVAAASLDLTKVSVDKTGLGSAQVLTGATKTQTSATVITINALGASIVGGINTAANINSSAASAYTLVLAAGAFVDAAGNNSAVVANWGNPATFTADTTAPRMVSVVTSLAGLTASTANHIIITYDDYMTTAADVATNYTKASTGTLVDGTPTAADMIGVIGTGSGAWANNDTIQANSTVVDIGGNPVNTAADKVTFTDVLQSNLLIKNTID